MTSIVRTYLKKNRLMHFLVNYYRDKEFRRDYGRYIEAKSLKKSRRCINRELNLIRYYWGCPPYHYYYYNLYLKELTDDQLLDYIPPLFYTNCYWESRNKELDKSIYQNKLAQYELFRKHQIPTMDLVAVTKNNVLLNSDNTPVEIIDLIEKYLKSEKDALVFKPEYGRGGHGIIFISRMGNNLFANNQHVTSDGILQLLAKNEDYLIQERFIQSRKMSEINESSVNTLRIYTQVKGNKIVMPACVLRIGLKNTHVDNFSQGGLMIVVDVENGSLAEFAQTKNDSEKYYEHPDSRFVFKNSAIDNWAVIKRQVLEFANSISECKDLGWDVAIGDNGIKVLEINIIHGLGVQKVIGGMRRILGVYPESITP